ncbi:MAG: glycosyltransferase family 2 protein [Patescibacteria group bacterium]
MQQNHPLVSINLLAWNGQKYIKKCLDSVFEQTYPNLEINIIDNGSKDNTPDYFKNLPDQPNLRIAYNSQNIGFAAGHNQLIKRSQGKFILCLNQDVILDKDFIKEAIRLFNQDEKIGAIQGKLLRWQKEYLDTTGLVMLKNRRIINRGQGQLDQGQFEKTEEIFGADGAAPIFRKTALEDIKLTVRQRTDAQNHNQIKDLNDFGEYFDEDFFAYKEDVDLDWRLRLYGWKAFYQPKAIAYHDRTAGDSAAISYWAIVKERLKISQFGKYLAFKNQRLMQIKNEQISLLIRHSPWFLPKEIGAWFFAALFERYTRKAFRALFKQAPRAWQKRKIIMSRKRIGAQEMNKWFQ